MRFAPMPRHGFTWSNRKAAAVLVRQRKDRDRLPLFAAAIAETQPDVDQVRDARESNWIRHQVDRRQREAAAWCKVRRAIAELADHDRRLFLDHWNRGSYPGNASYCATVLHMFATGRLVEHNGKLESAHWIEHDRKLRAKLEAMSDQELEATIQSHVNLHFVELGRQERRRRFELELAAAPARRVTRPTRRPIGGRR